MASEDFLSVSSREFQRLKRLAEGALAQVSDEEFFAAPGAGDNSIAVVVKHVGGNLISRWTDFLIADGEKPSRDREAEFEIQPGDSREQLMARWNQGWTALFGALAPLTDHDLQRPVVIRGETLSVLQATTRQLTHYAYHVGQIVYVAKLHRGSAWKSLSIPRGESAHFNRSPKKYLA